jgi:DNA-binding CsgD family transcriptional regulator
MLPAEPPSTARAIVLAALARASLGLSAASATGVAEEAVRAARAAGAEREEANALVTLGSCYGHGGQGDRGLEALRAGLAIALRLGDHSEAVRAHINRSDVYATMGRHEDALAAGREGMAYAEQVGLATSRGSFLAGNVADSLVRLGRFDEAREVATAALQNDASGIGAANLHCVFAELAACQGDADRFRTELAVVRRLTASAYTGQYSLPFAFQGALVARDAGDPAEAARLGEAALAGPSLEWPRYVWPLAWLQRRLAHEVGSAAALGALDPEVITVTSKADEAYREMVHAESAPAPAEAVRRWQAAVSLWRELGDLFLLAHALLQLGEVLVEEKARDAATDALGEAAALARQLGAMPLVERIESLVRRARLPHQRTGATTQAGAQLPGLTSREVDVLRLIAEGHSNSQIATSLFISPKTVSVHVTNLLAKLGVANRREAAALAYRSGLLEG